MTATPRRLLESAVRSACGRDVARLDPLAGGGMNETHRAVLADGQVVVVRVARRREPWFTDEADLMGRARSTGVPTPEVVGIEHVEHGGDVLSFSIQRFVPGRSLDALARELGPAERERLVVDAGELLARVHSTVADRGIPHALHVLDDAEVERVTQVVGATLGARAAAVVERGAAFVRREMASRPTPQPSLAQGDFLPKNLLVRDGAIVGVIDWEFAGPAPPAFDLARWEVSAGTAWHDRSDLLWRGYARVTDPERAAGGLVPAYAVGWALEKLGWRNPAALEQRRRCVAVIARHAAA